MLIYLLPKAGILPQAGNVAITKTNFSDDIFRQYVQEHFDKDQNGILSDAELSSVTEIILVDTIVVLDDTVVVLDDTVVDTTVVAMDTEYPIIVPETKIKSLAGIEYFTNLTKLDCRNNSISTLDVSKNTALTTLDCSYNSISTLDVSKNTALTTLVCSFNSLSTLDVSKNTALTTLDCGENSISTLDVRNNTALTELCYSDQHLEDCKKIFTKDGVFKLDMREVVGVENIDSISVDFGGTVKSYEDGIVTFSSYIRFINSFTWRARQIQRGGIWMQTHNGCLIIQKKRYVSYTLYFCRPF